MYHMALYQAIAPKPVTDAPIRNLMLLLFHFCIDIVQTFLDTLLRSCPSGPSIGQKGG